MNSKSEPRIPPLALEECDELQREVLKAWTLPDGRIYNLFLTTARHPDLLRRWYPYGMHVMVKSTLPARDRELVIMRVAVLSRSDYEWAHHAKISHEVGITDEELARVVEGPDAEGWTDFERLLLRSVDEMKLTTDISDAVWEGLRTRYDDKRIMDLIHTDLPRQGRSGMLEEEVEGLSDFCARMTV